MNGDLLLAGYAGIAAGGLDRLNFGSGSSADTGFARYALVELLTGPQACRDGVDNDGDALTDFAGGDPGCDSPLDPHEETLLDTDFEHSSRVIDRVVSRIENYEFQNALRIAVGAACYPTHAVDAESLKRQALSRPLVNWRSGRRSSADQN